MEATRPATHLLLLCAFSLLSLTCSAAKISYEDHCGSVVPASIPTGVIAEYGSQRRFLRLPSGFCSDDAGHKLSLSKISANSSSTSSACHCRFQFYQEQIHETRDDSVFQVVARFLILSCDTNSFDLLGFWSTSTGKLCMVGSFYGRSVVVKLDYHKASNIYTSLVTGTVETLGAEANGLLDHSNNMSLLAYSNLDDYEYTMIDQANESCSVLKLEEEGEERVAIATGPAVSACFNISAHLYETLYTSSRIGNGCTGSACRPLLIGHGSLPGSMSLHSFRCSDLDMKLRFAIHGGFSNMNLSKEASLAVAEGFWDAKRRLLCAVACPILEDQTSGDLSVGECNIGLSLWFPAAVTLKSRSTVVGRMWSNKKAEESDHLAMVSFQSGGNSRRTGFHAGVKYRYTYNSATVKSFCKANHDAKIGKKRLYPDGTNIGDMQFQISGKDAKGHDVWGHASVIAIDETIYGNEDHVVKFSSIFDTRMISAATIADPDSSSSTETSTPTVPRVWNISYQISWTHYYNASTTTLDAEGTYSAPTGQLCMVGCRNMDQGPKLLDSNSTLDCEVAVHVQFAPLNPEAGDHITGTIVSKRSNSDPLYFEPIEVSSYVMYTGQAKETIKRMDTEVFLVTSSLTLLCMCIVAQLRHGKRNPSVLPSISITMLVVLALGHMIPLVLNFEALFFADRRGHRNILLGNGGWLEANEVIVRIMTMIAFLLQCRLLQTAFSARSTDQGNTGGLWSAERESLMICFPLYLAGGLITWVVVHNSMSHTAVVDELVSYAGLVLDSFLLPQIVLNLYRNSKDDEALTPFFYVGTTAVRVLPHLYDLYRSRHDLPRFHSSYLFARPGDDFFSWAWDVIISFVGVLLALLLFVQQRFGGECILPTRCSRAG